MTVRRLLAALAVALVATFAASSVRAAQTSGGEEPVLRFVEVPPLTAAVMSSNRVRGLVSVQITIEVLKPDQAIEVQRKLPRIQATLLNVVQRHVGRLRSSRELLDIDAMMGDMQRNTDIVAGNGTVRPLIQNVNYTR